jgi:hypothetical protein
MRETTPFNAAGSAGLSNADAASYDVAYRTARRRVRMLRGWYVHALIYACVIVGLWTAYALSTHSPRFAWPLPPTLGWGLGLAIHGLVVWLGTSNRGRQWEARKIEQYMHEDLASRRDTRQ